jgi:predicted cupin superfamily sugar epimerase
MHLSASWIIEHLGLKPHATCGFTNEAYTSADEIPAGSLPADFQGSRRLGGVLYFLVTPQAPVRLHCIRSDQMYHHYLGDPLEVLLLKPGDAYEVRLVGIDLAAGMRPQLLIPARTFHAGRVLGNRGYSLLGTSVWARAEPSDVEMGDLEQLKVAYPKTCAEIAAFVGQRSGG